MNWESAVVVVAVVAGTYAICAGAVHLALKWAMGELRGPFAWRRRRTWQKLERDYWQKLNR